MPIRYNKKVSFFLMSLREELKEILSELEVVDQLIDGNIDQKEFEERIFTDDY
jgi:Trp operon repressor